MKNSKLSGADIWCADPIEMEKTNYSNFSADQFWTMIEMMINMITRIIVMMIMIYSNHFGTSHD